MNITQLTPQQLRDAADLQEKILGLRDELNQIFGGEVPAPDATEAPRPVENGRRKRRQLSPEGRARIAAAQRARWAAKRGEAVPETAPAADEAKAKKRRNISEAGRKAMSLAGKRRWKKVRTAKVESKPRKKRRVTAAVLRGLARARAARSAKAKAARDDVPF